MWACLRSSPATSARAHEVPLDLCEPTDGGFPEARHSRHRPGAHQLGDLRDAGRELEIRTQDRDRQDGSLDSGRRKYPLARAPEDPTSKECRAFWNREVSHKCCYTFDEIAGDNPHPMTLPGEPDPTNRPPVSSGSCRRYSAWNYPMPVPTGEHPDLDGLRCSRRSFLSRNRDMPLRPARESWLRIESAIQCKSAWKQ